MLHSLMLVPGPVNISLRVHEALVRPVLSPLQHEYRHLRQRLELALLACYNFTPEQWCVIPLAAPTQLAVEVVLQHLNTVSAAELLAAQDSTGVTSPQQPQAQQKASLAIVSLDPSAQRWQVAAHMLGIPLECLDCCAMPASQLAQNLASWLAVHPEIRHVVLPHVTSDRAEILPVADLVPVLKQARVGLILDASLSFAVEEISPDWPLSAIVCRSDTGLHSTPGLSMLIVRRQLLDHVLTAETLARDDSMKQLCTSASLSSWCDPGPDQSVPSQLLQACLSACLEHHEQGGWMARRRRYQRLHEALTRVMKRYGVIVSESPRGYLSASSLRAYCLPELLSPKQFAQQLLGQGFILDPTAHPDEDCVLVSLMGDMDELVMTRLHHAVEDILHPISVHVGA